MRMRRLKFSPSPAAMLAWLLSVVTWFACSGFAQTVKTVAGGFVGDGGLPTNAAFQEPFFIAQDTAGNLYVSDFSACRVRTIAADYSAISTYAGTGICGYTGDKHLAKDATLGLPTGLAFDNSGNLYIADGTNNVIRKVNKKGVITTFAGTGAAGYSGDNGPAKDATFLQPFGLVFDGAGNLYITDIGNHVVRKIDTSPNHIITTYAGNGTYGYSGDGGPATDANLSYPRGMAVDGKNNLYIADTDNFRVRVVDHKTHNINTFAGDGSATFSGDGGPAINAGIGRATGLTFHKGAIYLNGVRSRVRYVPISSGIINTFAGSFYGYDGDNQALLASEFARPIPFFDSAGHLIVVDSFNARVRKATGSGVMKTIAGGFLGDGQKGTSAALVQPENLAFDSAGNYYIADAGGNRIRKVDGSGNITTVAGNGISGSGGDGGPATAANLYYPEGVVPDSNGNLYIADTFNGVIRKVDASQNISTFAADPNFSDLTSLALDTSGNLYSADDGACVVRKITPQGAISVVAGIEFNCGYNGDNIPATSALLNGPFGLAVDAKGNLYLGDYANNRVRKVTSGGIIKTIAGDGNCGFTGDGGPATSAEVCLPWGVAVNAAGTTVVLADLGNLRVRKIVKGTINTVAGSGNFGYNGEGLAALSTNLDDVVAVALGPKNVVHFVDDQTTRVRRVH